MLASGPRCGLNEINLPQMQPGSSIMPGKVNPVIPEVVNQTSFLVIGLDVTVTLAASAGQLQLNVMEPVITFALFASIATMERAVKSLRVNCVEGITANAERTRDMVLNSLAIVTVLKPSLGYKQCAEIAREGYETGKSAPRHRRDGEEAPHASRNGTRSSRLRISSTPSSSSEPEAVAWPRAAANKEGKTTACIGSENSGTSVCSR